MPHQLFNFIGWTTAIYVAVVLQTGLDVGTTLAFAAMAAAWAITNSPRSTGLLWAAVAGLACDVAGHDRLGLHLASYAVLAAAASASLPETLRRTHGAALVIAGLIAGGDAFVSGVAAGWVHEQFSTTPQIAWQSIKTALLTAASVWLCASVVWLLRRAWPAPMTARSVRLSNRWTMLTE